MRNAYIVRYGSMLNISTFSTRSSPDEIRLGDKVIVRSDRGCEYGVAVQVSAEEEALTAELPQILRKVTPDDEASWKKIQKEDIPKEFKFCQEKIRELKLPMKLVDLEHLFGAEKIIFYFLAEGRVDFRQLVKELAAQYHTRIELKQIGVRDEARLLADYEHCGREICCKAFIKEFEPVTIKMAKSQKATLDPAKISGRCGRLMCCLRFEDKTYEELKRNLPRKGTLVTTRSGEKAEVVDYDVLKQTVTIETQDNRRLVAKCVDLVWEKSSSEVETEKREDEGV